MLVAEDMFLIRLILFLLNAFSTVGFESLQVVYKIWRMEYTTSRIMKISFSIIHMRLYVIAVQDDYLFPIWLIKLRQYS